MVGWQQSEQKAIIILQFAKTTFRGFTDFAGSAVVHLAGAVLSLPGCVILGARFSTPTPPQPPPPVLFSYRHGRHDRGHTTGGGGTFDWW